MQKLNERKSVGILYHFINWRKMDFLIDKKFIFSFNYDELGLNDRYYLSTTRKYNFDWGNIRITLDGDKLSSKYKIIPIHFFNKGELDNYKWKRKNFKDPNVVEKPKDLRNYGMKTGEESKFGNQYEERIISNFEDNDLSKCILQIDILDTISDSDFLYLSSVMENYNIPIYKVSKFEPYHLKQKKYVLKHLQKFENYKK